MEKRNKVKIVVMETIHQFVILSLWKFSILRVGFELIAENVEMKVTTVTRTACKIAFYRRCGDVASVCDVNYLEI